MNLKVAYIVFFLSMTLACQMKAQREIGSWKNYMAYQNASHVAETPNKVFAIYDGSMISYEPEDGAVKFYSKADGLNDTGISHLAYEPNNQSLVIIYENSNIDIMTNQGIFNIHFIKDNLFIPDKTINNLEFIDNKAYLSTAFGIVVLDLERKEVKETYSLQKKTHSVCVLGQYIYAATTEGVLEAALNTNLLDRTNWKHMPLTYPGGNDADIRKLFIHKNELCFFQLQNGVYHIDKDKNISLIRNAGHETPKIINDKLILFRDDKTYFYTDFDSYKELDGIKVTDISSSKKTNRYWISEADKGLVGIEIDENANITKTILSELKINSPKRNWARHLTLANDQLLVVGGGRTSDRLKLPGTFMVLENNSWHNYDENEIAKTTGLQCEDFLSAVVDPRDPQHHYVSSWGEGVYEFKDKKFVKLHNSKNSGLASIYPGANSEDNFVRTDGMAYDKQNNLHILNSEVANGIVTLSADGRWISSFYNELNGRDALNNLLITTNGHLWVNIDRNPPGIFAVNNKNTIGNVGDDIVKAAKVITDTDGKTVPTNGFYCMAEDLNATVWMGTDNGPILFSSNILTNNTELICSRVKIAIDDGTDAAYYLLEGQKVTSIAIDGANRKWIGTEGAGLFLVNATNTEVIETFTAENSLLISNIINCLAINNNTGEVFVGTDKGIVSYMGDAITGKIDYSDVYAYPNPVRPEYQGRVAITGLMHNSNVKITDLQGNLLSQGPSNGGVYSWDCTNQAGRRVGTGIYLVLSSSGINNGSMSVVTKIMIVK